MDPEDLLPSALVFFGLLGAAARRLRGWDQPPPTVGRQVGSAGEVVSRGAASVLRVGGRVGVDVTSEALGMVGAAASAAGGAVIDGVTLAVGALAVPVLRRGSRVVIGVPQIFFPAGKPADETGSALEGRAVEVMATPRGKRFHRASCALAPAEGLTLSREAAVESGRQPCPTCRP